MKNNADRRSYTCVYPPELNRAGMERTMSFADRVWMVEVICSRVIVDSKILLLRFVKNNDFFITFFHNSVHQVLVIIPYIRLNDSNTLHNH